MKARRMVVLAGAILFALSSYAHAWIPTGLKWPTNVQTMMLSAFGDNWIDKDVCTSRVKKHTGIDLSLSANTPVYATYGGMVQARFLSSTSTPLKDWGEAVTISHGDTISRNWWTSTYHHIDPVVKAGKYVQRGELIGYVHKTIAFGVGYTHLHFGVRDAAYSNISNAGALPQNACGGYPAFAEYFKNPYTLSYATAY